MRKESKIPNWVWVVIAILVLIIFVLFFVMNDDAKNNENNPTERLCIDMCEGQKTLCDSQVRVFGEDRDCNAEWDRCIDSCDL